MMCGAGNFVMTIFGRFMIVANQRNGGSSSSGDDEYDEWGRKGGAPTLLQDDGLGIPGGVAVPVQPATANASAARFAASSFVGIEAATKTTTTISAWTPGVVPGAAASSGMVHVNSGSADSDDFGGHNSSGGPHHHNHSSQSRDDDDDENTHTPRAPLWRWTHTSTQFQRQVLSCAGETRMGPVSR
jgi:hypothetical protein